MRAPAAAALLLAALAALPCRGIDADTASRIPDNQETGFQPTINILYQMLHTTDYNRTKVNLNSNFKSDDVTVKECCSTEVTTEGIHKGAKVVNETVLNDKKNRQRRLVNVDRTVYGSLSEVGVEVTTVTSVISPPPLMERRRKPGETGSSAPLLNYIFDTYPNTHQHWNGKVSPGNSIYAAAAPEIEALVGSTAHLDCKVDALHDKLVSWVRRKGDEQPMELLTTGTQQYTADDRYSARFIPPDIWRLEVKEVRPSDAAHYDCQLSAHPPRTARVTLHVPEVSVRIVDGAGAEVSEQVCELGSTVALRCEVRGLRMEGGPSLLWFRRESLLNDDTTRGGISVRTEFGANGANSVLRVARVRSDDAGRYTCSVARAPPPAPPPAHVILHVIKGESLAELHQGGSTRSATNVWLVIFAAIQVHVY
ncbi:hypothetical protein ABMA27_014204 [Loxostege sticticalis]|uniref:Ig-like domain-containing protein n=1 Tax=Loxostege sticticalis TaxID=481309 RepID=A0ABR3ID62_LOXSC